MTASSMADTVQILSELLADERASAFRFMRDAEPYAARASAGFRRALGELVSACERHERELAEMIDRLDGSVGLAAVVPAHQYLAFLSLEHLRPRLLHEAQLGAARYEAALAATQEAGQPVREMLQRHRDDYLRFIERAGQ